MKIVYEIVRIEEDKIFIIPHNFNHERSDEIDSFITDVYKNILKRPAKWVSFFSLGGPPCLLEGPKVIFGFDYREFQQLSWFKERYPTLGGYKWLTHHREPPIARVIGGFHSHFIEYVGEVPQESEITGFPSSALFDI
jgi:hypothetical protein